jgi:hypothetical protein
MLSKNHIESSILEDEDIIAIMIQTSDRIINSEDEDIRTIMIYYHNIRSYFYIIFYIIYLYFIILLLSFSIYYPLVV